MKVLNKIYDRRIKALNVLLEVTLKEYHDISEEIIKKNEFQRRRVKSSSTVYSLLKSDLLQGCVIPPIVLALSKIDKTSKIEEQLDPEIIEHIQSKKENLVILDGLQRTYTIRDLVNELEQTGDSVNLEILLNYKLRIETYIGIDKLGILYRMLTLNTGQTPMSIRHQIEILYSDYLVEDFGEIKFITEADDSRPKKFGEYKFKDVVEGFNSYLERDYLTIDRYDILDNIKSLEKLSKENQDKDLFMTYVSNYHHLAETFVKAADSWEFNDTNGNQLTGQPFGKSVDRIFSKSQVMTGFGSAVGKLIDFELIESLDDISVKVDKIDLTDIDDALDNLISKLDSVRTLAKKIGNDQRMYFHFLFRELFDRKGDAHLDFKAAIEEAYKSYERKTQ